jgi:two-component system, LytTR family, response regulator
MEPLIKAVIIDDEADGRNILALLLEQHFPFLQLNGFAENVMKGVKLVREVKPDLIFLDIEMPDGTGFDLLSTCSDIQSHVILVTAHNHYALKAIKASVLDYLLKPVNREEFIVAVNKALNKYKKEDKTDLSLLLESVNRHLTIRKVRIPTLSGFSLVNADDIVHCEASGNYTIINFENHTKIVASQALGEYEAELKNYGFVRIHHKHLININKVLEYNKGKAGGGFVTLAGREVLEVSARRKANFIHAFGK